MSATISLPTPHQSHLRLRLFAAGAALAVAAGGAAWAVAVQNDTAATPAPVVTPAPVGATRDDPLVNRYGRPTERDYRRRLVPTHRAAVVDDLDGQLTVHDARR